MSITVLIVDDSRFICNRIRAILEDDPEFIVVGIAMNGQEAVSMAIALKPDPITMDIDMPVIDGITAVKQIMAAQPCPILMFSAMTQVGAQATFDALQAGAMDFLPKQLSNIDADRDAAKYLLRHKIRNLVQHAGALRRHPWSQLGNGTAANKPPVAQTTHADILLIAASTGGPTALQHILPHIKANVGLPILLVQHMPAHFTKSFAERLDRLSQIQVREAQESELLQPGTALLAPGGLQMRLRTHAGEHRIALSAKQIGDTYSPSADITFSSVAEQFRGRVLAIVLTGMGEDGRYGAQHLKRQSAEIWAQDEASCVIYGMPKAVADAGLADKIIGLDQIAADLEQLN